VNRDVPLPVLALADMLCASADDLRVALTRRDADRLADHTLALLQLAGYELVHHPKDN
jgi:hypothetical protein